MIAFALRLYQAQSVKDTKYIVWQSSNLDKIAARSRGNHMSITNEHILNALRELIDPVTDQNYVEGKAAKNIIIEGGKVSLEIALGYPGKSVTESIRRQVVDRLMKIDGVEHVAANVYSRIVSHSAQRGVKLNPNIKNIIAVASGKGGVTMLGITGRPQSKDGKTMEAMEGHGIQAMSVGFLIDPETPMVWRGPMVTQALEQLLNETRWNNLDYLVIDLPPGTGDIQLTLAQKVPVTGAVIVTTPQDIALLDARKGLKMFEKVGVPIIGIVENMAMHTCSNCGHTEHIFGEGGGGRMASDYNVELLGSLPLDIKIREMADSGKPTVVSDPDGPASKIYKLIARKCAAKIAKQSQDRSAIFPKIVIQNT